MSAVCLLHLELCIFSSICGLLVSCLSAGGWGPSLALGWALPRVSDPSRLPGLVHSDVEQVRVRDSQSPFCCRNDAGGSPGPARPGAGKATPALCPWVWAPAAVAQCSWEPRGAPRLQSELKWTLQFPAQVLAGQLSWECLLQRWPRTGSAWEPSAFPSLPGAVPGVGRQSCAAGSRAPTPLSLRCAGGVSWWVSGFQCVSLMTKGLGTFLRVY